jgi:5-methylcytosine-specific restriction enzyme A
MGGPGSGPRRRSRWPSNRGWRDLYQLERWRKISRRKLDASPCCALCASRGLVVPATVTDHIVEHRGDPRKFWDETNLQTLCASCNNGAKRRGYLLGTEEHGEPVDQAHPWFK